MLQPHKLGEELRRLKKEDPEKLKFILSQMSEEEAHSIAYDPDVWLREDQQIKDEWPEPVIMFLCGRGFGKDLALSTPMLTKNKGWVTMGDIEVGDVVYAWDGSPTEVLECYEPEPRQLVEFTFSDGEKIISSVEHDWVTLDRSARRAISRHHNTSAFPEDWVNWVHVGRDRWGNPRGTTSAGKRTTQEIIDTFRDTSTRGDLNHSIPLCKPLQGEHNNKITDPYYLGMWLGDGLSASAHSMACGKEDEWWLFKNWPDFKHIGNCVYRRPAGSVPFIYDFELRNNKHIPDCVFSASFEQRLAVLQGLMDSDGYAERSFVEFTSIKEDLANDVLELVRGLGQKPVMYIGDATLNGRVVSKKYRITWRPVQGINPFRLPRKAEKIKFGGNQEMRNYQRMITSWKYVDYEPTKCIYVSHKDHLFLAGKSLIATHNTFLGAQWLRKQVNKGVKGEIALVAPTASMVRDTMVNSGLIPLSPEKEGLVYEPSKSRIVWANGTIARLVSADGGEEKLRGMNSEVIWVDELGSIPNKDVYDQAMLTLRVGQSRMLITTTPRTTETIIYLYKNAVFNDDPPQKGKFCRILTRSTYANFDNLSLGYQQNIIASYEGTRLGRQELEGILLLNAENALWSLDLIARQTLEAGEAPPKLERIAVGVDPAMSNSSKSDKTGIVVAGLGEDGKAYVLEDVSGKYSPDTWVKKVHGLYDKYSEYAPTSIVVELNQGGSLVTQTLQRDRPFLPVDGVFATRNKLSRAEPVAMLYEQGKVFHCHGLAELEEEMATFEGDPKQKSPDRLDSMVMAITHLIPAQRRITKGFEFLV